METGLCCAINKTIIFLPFSWLWHTLGWAEQSRLGPGQSFFLFFFPSFFTPKCTGQEGRQAGHYNRWGKRNSQVGDRREVPETSLLSLTEKRRLLIAIIVIRIIPVREEGREEGRKKTFAGRTSPRDLRLCRSDKNDRRTERPRLYDLNLGVSSSEREEGEAVTCDKKGDLKQRYGRKGKASLLLLLFLLLPT